MAQVPTREQAETTETETPEKVKKVYFPGLQCDSDGKASVQVATVPEDFDPKKHKALRRTDFVKESTYFRLRADTFETKAKELRAQADLSDKLGTDADRAKATKLRNMAAKMAELRTHLEKQGIDVSEILGEEDTDTTD